MLTSLLLAFREAVEAFLVVGIVLGFLRRTGQTRFNRSVYAAIFFGVAGSVAGAWLFVRLTGGFDGRAEQIFEGTVMLIGAVMITTMILWVLRHEKNTAGWENQVAGHVQKASATGIFVLVASAILREGIELVLFVGSANLVSKDNNLIGVFAGMLLAGAFSLALFRGLVHISLRKFFVVTNLLLLIFAAGLVEHSVHEYQEAAVLPRSNYHVWNINPPLNADGSFPPLHDQGTVGSILSSLFGYSGNPSVLEVVGYVGYVVVIGGLWFGLRTRRPSAA